MTCGTEYMDLSIYLCPIYHALYNESLMVLNNELSQECFGEADWDVDPPVLKYKFPLNESAISFCNNDFKVFFSSIYDNQSICRSISPLYILDGSYSTAKKIGCNSTEKQPCFLIDNHHDWDRGV